MTSAKAQMFLVLVVVLVLQSAATAQPENPNELAAVKKATLRRG